MLFRYALAASVLATAAAVVSSTQEPHKVTPQAKQGATPPAEQVFSGTSKEGKFQEALDAALQTAQQSLAKSTQVADMQLQFKVAEITGKRGGLMGTTELTVKVQITGGVPAPR